MPCIALIFVLLIQSLWSNAQQPQPDTTTIATVNGHPICLKELKMSEQNCKTSVIRAFVWQHRDTPFNQNIGNDTTVQILLRKAIREEALKNAIYSKIQQQLALQFGLVKHIDYVTFLHDLTIENQRRQEAKLHHLPIYGPMQYSEENYYDYLFSNLVVHLKEKLSQSVIKTSDRELKKAYDQRKTTSLRLPDYLRIKRTTMEQTGQKTKLIVLDPTKPKVHEGEIDEELRQRFESTKVHAKLKSTFPGEQHVEYELLERKSMGYRKFDEVRNTLKKALTDSLYAKYIFHKQSEATIVLF